MQVFVVAFSLFMSTLLHAETWIEKSNKLAEEFTLDASIDSPELASSLGYSQFDMKAANVVDDMEANDLAFNKKWKERLEKELQVSTDENYILDLKVLLTVVENGLEGLALNEKYGDIPFYPASKIVFTNLQITLNPQSGDDRKKATVDRFKVYVNGHEKIKPLLEAYQSRIDYREKKFQLKSKFYVLKNEVELYLQQSQDYVSGVKDLLLQSGRDDWKSDFEKFEKQTKTYDNFVRESVLPKARTDYKMPKEIYSFILKSKGIDNTPDDLINNGLRDYKKLYAEFKKTADVVAKKYNLKNNDPAFVINFLKSKPIANAVESEKMYKEIDLELSKIINDNRLVSMPTAPLKIRIAGDAESKASPVPHLTMPPLVNNKGERPEFVVPTSSTGKLPFDDFSYREATYILLAHEGRPGHDLQFSAMLDNGVSVIRARYAFNNVNAEGWALNAEDLVLQYLPPEAQFPALQFRLWRIARMFLDPQIQLGLINTDRVMELFTKELGVSQVMAGLEVRRYTYQDPGQAPAYYYGLLKIRAMREEVKKVLNAKYTEKCFSDNVLAMGLLPIDLIAEQLKKNIKCEM